MDFYRADGSRSLCRLKRWAGLTGEEYLQNSPELLEQEKKELDAYKRIANVLQLDSQKLLQYWWDYINNWDYITDANKTAGEQPTAQYESEEQRLLRNMLYYTLYRKNPRQEGFVSMESAIATLLADCDIRQEFLDILAYKLQRIDFVPVANEYAYVCPLEVHCHYNIRQIMAAYGYYNEESAPEFREGVKYFADKKTDVFLINLNKSEKDFSPSTMYEDYAINDTLFHWQTQSSLSATAATTQRYINPEVVTSLFVREYKKTGTYTAAYTFLGNVDYVSHQGSKPVSFCWKLHQPIPAGLLAKANKSVAI